MAMWGKKTVAQADPWNVLVRKINDALMIGGINPLDRNHMAALLQVALIQLEALGMPPGVVKDSVDKCWEIAGWRDGVPPER